jgi:hypothetical protein
MKTISLKISMFFLLFCLMGAGCEKEKETNYESNGIVGKWQLLQLPETCAGFRDEMIEITPDSVLKRYIDGELDLTSTFNIKTGSMGYDTIFYHSPNAEYDYESIALIGNDTLHLVPPILTLTATCDYFKRKK